MFPLPRWLLFLDYRKYPLQAEKIDCNSLVSLTELQCSFLKTPWVLPTLTQNHAARRKEIKYFLVTWDEGISEDSFSKILCWPIFPLWGFYSKGTSPEAMTRLQGVWEGWATLLGKACFVKRLLVNRKGHSLSGFQLQCASDWPINIILNSFSSAALTV